MAFLVTKKYRETSKDSVRKPWLEFSGTNPLPSNPSEPSAQADNCLTIRAGPRRTGRLFSEQRRREEQALLAQDYALEQAEEKGLERGKVEGREEGKLFAFLDMVRQGLLTSEVASQQLGMTVAEFEALL